MKNKSNLIKALGLVATIVGFAAEVLSDYVDEKQMDEKIDEKINEALALRDNNNEES